MSDKDQLLKQQREEIEKLKKELQDASEAVFNVFCVQEYNEKKCP